MEMNSELTINLKTLADNYKNLDAISDPSCETAAVVKANAYGLGIEQCAPVLYEAGARSFFVTTSAEGVVLRKVIPADSTIYVLNCLDDVELYKNYNLIPVLNSMSEIAQAKGMSVAIHFDTGMNRLGLEENDELELEALDVRLIMSHLVSSEEKDSPENPEQLRRFKEIIKNIKPKCPNARFSIANSGGISLGKDYHFGLVRPGIALYESCVHLSVPALQIKFAQKGDSAGYNSTHYFEKDTDLVIVSIGYADGLPRSLSNKGTFYWKNYALPIRGHISMDLVICDLENVPKGEYPERGDMIEIIGDHQSINDLAEDAGTISYEILTSLGKRYKRKYV